MMMNVQETYSAICRTQDGLGYEVGLVEDGGRERRGITTSDQYQNQYHEYKFIHDPCSNQTTTTTTSQSKS